MSVALEAANKAQLSGEVPVGCVLVHPKLGPVITYNQCELNGNALHHAEALAISMMSQLVNSYRLNSCSMYITLEPCVHCCGAIILSRIEKVFFGAYEPKSGAAKTLYKILDENQLNHKCQVFGGLLEEPSSYMLKQFFKNKRILKPK